VKRSRLRPVSKKRRALNAERAQIMLCAFGPRDQWVCIFQHRPEWRAVLGGDCFGPVNGHELVKRSQGGSITDISNIRLVCDYHNGAIENYPDKAHDLGLMRHGWEK
jgi:hypothetical protein